MKEITLHNKIFEVSITDSEISDIINSMANQINNQNIERPLFIAVLNGSFLFAADIMRKITIPNAKNENHFFVFFIIFIVAPALMICEILFEGIFF